ncbi:MAG TPA: Coenzyme F420 hydrogenase/dehydrogenase, beta subunit C-terminal domain [Acidimicrobiales bacterium]|nr:Coenzyme F420 hydrogenase/dehydrogenase, beta subunit C-terminal domain [Acidimicrobiales bacterium]
MTDLLDPPVAADAPADEALPPFRLRESMNGMGEVPGKVWFFELAAAVIDADRCIRCGTCIAACPTDSLGVNADDLPYLVKMCTGCSLCWDFCPRGGLRYEATWPEARLAPALSSADGLPDVITGGPAAPDLGVVREGYAARVRAESKYRAPGAQDGGVVTAILLAALEEGTIDGALVAREDPTTPWRGVPHLATTREEIIEAGGSFYNQTLALAALDLTKTGLGADARIALVGTPCEIQGIRALQSREWRWGSSRVDAVTLTIALLCTKSFDYRKLMLGDIATVRDIPLEEVGKVDVIHGRFFVWDRQGAVLVDEPVKAFHGAALKGCDECADFLGRGADLSVGSVGSDAGYSSVLVRTAAGAAAFALVAEQLEIGEIERPEALEKLDQFDKRTAAAALARPLDPTAPLFIDFAEHLERYGPTDRAPVWQGR